MQCITGLCWLLSGKKSACNAGDAGSIPGWGRPAGGVNDNPLQYSCLGNPMKRGAWLQSMESLKSWIPGGLRRLSLMKQDSADTILLEKKGWREQPSVCYRISQG